MTRNPSRGSQSGSPGAWAGCQRLRSTRRTITSRDNKGRPFPLRNTLQAEPQGSLPRSRYQLRSLLGPSSLPTSSLLEQKGRTRDVGQPPPLPEYRPILYITQSVRLSDERFPAEHVSAGKEFRSTIRPSQGQRPPTQRPPRARSYGTGDMTVLVLCLLRVSPHPSRFCSLICRPEQQPNRVTR
ncbi:hypothetical protein LY76DRAFT_22297 [Colletotrichum caudatum]|nr:hypothetical protein LY76DRAFT_22297 [Colletotrichum caudatum]